MRARPLLLVLLFLLFLFVVWMLRIGPVDQRRPALRRAIVDVPFDRPQTAKAAVQLKRQSAVHQLAAHHAVDVIGHGERLLVRGVAGEEAAGDDASGRAAAKTTTTTATATTTTKD